MIPEYDVVVIDEAHELSARVTQAATDELSRAGDRARGAPLAASTSRASEADDLADAGPSALRAAYDAVRGRTGRQPARRPGGRAGAGARRRPGAGLGVPQGAGGDGRGRPGPHPGARLGAGGLQDRRADGRQLRRATCSGSPSASAAAAATRCAWRRCRCGDSCATKLLSREDRGASPAHADAGRRLRHRRGQPRAQAGGAGRPARLEDQVEAEPRTGSRRRRARDRPDRGHADPWRGIDVGSPFDYARQGILYVAKHLPPPGRDGLGAGAARRDRRPGRRRRRPHPGAVLLAARPPRRPPRRPASGCRT